MGVKNLAEAIILQSLEDIWNPACRKESIEFFKGDGFKIYAELAGLDYVKRFSILFLLGGNKYERVF